MSLGSVRVAAELVPLVREGVLRELSAALETLSYQVDVVFDREAFDRALVRFDEARTLLEALGVSEPAESRALELELARWPRALLAALEGEHEAQLRRLEDRAVEGFALSAPQLAALRALLAEVRGKLAAPSGHTPEQPAPERGPWRYLRRSRGDE